MFPTTNEPYRSLYWNIKNGFRLEINKQYSIHHINIKGGIIVLLFYTINESIDKAISESVGDPIMNW